jgi:hypothetical protein
MNLSLGSSREHSRLRNTKESFSMPSQRSSTRLGAILSLLGGALVIYGVFFLPIVYGNGGGNGSIPVSEWTVAGFLGPTGMVLLALPLLSVLFVLATSAASLFGELSTRMVAWRRITALAGLFIQGSVGLGGAVFYSFSFNVGPGFWLVLLGFIVMSVGTFRGGLFPHFTQKHGLNRLLLRMRGM